MRTTCVATRLEGGHANNALPQRGAGHRELAAFCRAIDAKKCGSNSCASSPIRKIAVRFVTDQGEVLDTARAIGRLVRRYCSDPK